MGMTKGEYRVGIDFNPSGDDLVGKIKRAAADLIDLIETIQMVDPDTAPGLQKDAAVYRRSVEIVRLKSLAQTEIESAAMWAVKAATKPTAR